MIPPQQSANDQTPEFSPGSGSVALMTAEPKETETKRKLITLLLILTGFIALLYPVFSTHLNNAKQVEVARQYGEALDTVPEAHRSAELDRAKAFNETQQDGPILDPWLARITPDNAQYREYLEQLNINEAMARLRIPAIQVDLPVFHGTDMDTLSHGVGHLFGSALPIGGEGNHSVLTGHTGLATATLFDNLNKVEEGDAIYIQVMGEMLKYQVDHIKVVRPEETDDLRRVPGKDYITLITCTPYGINTHRLLVRGVRVPLDEAEKQEVESSQASIWQWWMVAILAAVVVLLLALLWIFYRARRRQQTALMSTEPERDHHDAP